MDVRVQRQGGAMYFKKVKIVLVKHCSFLKNTAEVHLIPALVSSPPCTVLCSVVPKGSSAKGLLDYPLSALIVVMVDAFHRVSSVCRVLAVAVLCI